MLKTLSDIRLQVIITDYIADWDYPYNIWLNNCQFQIYADESHMICWCVWSPSEEVIHALNVNQNFLKGRSVLLKAGCERVIFCYGTNHYADISGVFDIK